MKSPILHQRALPGGKIEYYGRYKMWSPIGNELDCRVRQLLFSVGRLANDLPQGNANGPTLSVSIQRGIFHRPAPEMKIDPNISLQSINSVLNLYTVDAQALHAKSGSYYAKISLIGLAPVR